MYVGCNPLCTVIRKGVSPTGFNNAFCRIKLSGPARLKSYAQVGISGLQEPWLFWTRPSKPNAPTTPITLPIWVDLDLNPSTQQNCWHKSKWTWVGGLRQGRNIDTYGACLLLSFVSHPAPPQCLLCFSLSCIFHPFPFWECSDTIVLGPILVGWRCLFLLITT